MTERRAKKKSTRGRKKARRADTVDRHALYETAVQAVGTDVSFLGKLHVDLRGHEALVLREDFCGTAQLAVKWCLSDRRRRAVAVDFDEEVLAWGRTHNVEPNARALGKRLELVHGDVLDVKTGSVADIVCAMNFSFCVFHERAVLARWLVNAREALCETGLLVLEIYGGTEAIEPLEEETRIEVGREGVDYVWEQESFDPTTHATMCHIHFQFDDGSRLKRAFTYDWRLWTIPELRDLLYEVGFTKVHVFFEEMEDDPDDPDMLMGSGNFVRVETAEQQDSWLAYVVAER